MIKNYISIPHCNDLTVQGSRCEREKSYFKIVKVKILYKTLFLLHLQSALNLSRKKSIMLVLLLQLLYCTGFIRHIRGAQ